MLLTQKDFKRLDILEHLVYVVFNKKGSENKHSVTLLLLVFMMCILDKNLVHFTVARKTIMQGDT